MSQQIQKVQMISTPDGQEEYLIKQQLGRGSSGVIYLVELRSKNTQQFQQQLAMKIQDSMQKNEVQIINLLMNNPCPNLLNIKKFWNVNGKYYIIMDLALGGNLYDFIATNKNKLSTQDIQKMFCQLSQGVSKLHNLNIIHRDLKPENILLSQSLSPFNLKICDYGLSKQQSNTCTMNIGTIYYMAPELLKNTGAYDKSIDIWALGCIWYYLVANVDLFTGYSHEEVNQSITNANQHKIDNAIQQLNLQDWEKQLMKSMIDIVSTKRPKIEEIMQQIDKGRPTYIVHQPPIQFQPNPSASIIMNQPKIGPTPTPKFNSIQENSKSVSQELAEIKSQINSLNQLVKDSNFQFNFKINEIQQQINLCDTVQSDTQRIEKIQSQLDLLQKSDTKIETQYKEIANKFETSSSDLLQINEQFQNQQYQITKLQTEQKQIIDSEILQLKSQLDKLLKSDTEIQTQYKEIANKFETSSSDFLQINKQFQNQQQQITKIQTEQKQIIDSEILQLKSQLDKLLKSDTEIQTQYKEIANKFETSSSDFLQINKQFQNQQQQITKIQTEQKQIIDSEILQLKSQLDKLLKSDTEIQTQYKEIANKFETSSSDFLQINKQFQNQQQQITKIQTEQKQIIDSEILQLKSQLDKLLKSDTEIQTQYKEIANKFETSSSDLLQINEQFQNQQQQITKIQTEQKQIIDQEILQLKSQLDKLLKSDTEIQTQYKEMANDNITQDFQENNNQINYELKNIQQPQIQQEANVGDSVVQNQMISNQLQQNEKEQIDFQNQIQPVNQRQLSDIQQKLLKQEPVVKEEMSTKDNNSNKTCNKVGGNNNQISYLEKSTKKNEQGQKTTNPSDQNKDQKQQQQQTKQTEQKNNKGQTKKKGR